MTQHEAIRQYINDYGSITPIEAFNDLGITKLATRISEMRKRGEEFKVERVEHTNRYGQTKKFCRYSKEVKP